MQAIPDTTKFIKHSGNESDPVSLVRMTSPSAVSGEPNINMDAHAQNRPRWKARVSFSAMAR